MSLSGLSRVRVNLHRAVGDIKGRLDKSMIAAGLYIQGQAQRLTPVDTGFLRGSAGTNWEKKDQGIRVVVYYSAWYSIYVHEIDRFHNVGTWKFLEFAIIAHWNDILEIIKQGPAIP